MDRATYLEHADGMRLGLRRFRLLNLIGACASVRLLIDTLPAARADAAAEAMVERMGDEIDRWELN